MILEQITEWLSYVAGLQLVIIMVQTFIEDTLKSKMNDELQHSLPQQNTGGETRQHDSL